MVKEEGDEDDSGDEDGRESREAGGLGSDDEDGSDQDDREKEFQVREEEMDECGRRGGEGREGAHAAGLVLVQDEIQLSREVGLGPRVREGRQGGRVEVGREFQGRAVQTERTGTWERGDRHTQREEMGERHTHRRLRKKQDRDHSHNLPGKNSHKERLVTTFTRTKLEHQRKCIRTDRSCIRKDHSGRTCTRKHA